MYIKIKNIKKFLLIFACIFLAGFNYLHFVKADNVSTKCDSSIDADCDGLTNEEEKLYGTNVNMADTDGDGYSDSTEVKSGYDPTKPAPNDKITASSVKSTENGSISSGQNSSSLTSEFAQNLKSFVATKGNTPITNSDLNNFVAVQLDNQAGAHITIETLPEIDSSQVKVLPQNYSNLSDSDRKVKMQEDAANYYSQIAYILASNAPTPLITDSDFQAFGQDFSDRLATFASTSPDYAYFRDLGDRIDLTLIQINEVAVPQSMVNMHTKALRIIKGFLSLRDTSLNYVSDPIARLVLLSKIQDLSYLVADFFGNDFQSYNQTLQ